VCVRMFLNTSSSCFETARLFESGEETADRREEAEPEEEVPPPPSSVSYAATVALPSTPPSASTLTGVTAEPLISPTVLQQNL